MTVSWKRPLADTKEVPKMRNRHLPIAMTLVLACTASAEIILRDVAPVDGASDKRRIEVPEPSGTHSLSGGETGEAGGYAQVLEFINRDLLHGRLASVSAGGNAIRWHHESSEQPLSFSVTAISRVTFPRRKRRGDRSHSAVVRLTNDDSLRGDIVSLDKDVLILDTWYAGRMKVQRAMLRSLSPGAARSHVIYDGPTDLTDWSFNNYNNQPTWRLKAETLEALQAYPIGRLFTSLPDMVSIEFEAEWLGGYPQFCFTLFTDNAQGTSGNCYMLQLSGTSFYVYRRTQNGSTQNLGTVNLSQFQRGLKSKAKFRILADKKGRLIPIVDGNVLQQFADSQPMQNRGNGISFQSQNNAGLKIRGIRITRWDGSLPKVLGSSDTETEEDLVRFMNDDQVSGSVSNIVDQKVFLKTAYSPLEVPLSRVSQIVFATASAERARRNKGDITAIFASGGKITVDLVSLDKGVVKGKSENIGEISMPVRAFRRLLFNIYRRTEE